jgi:putative transposase
VELDWLKKKLELPVNVKRGLIEPENKEISIVRQCELLGLPRASLYYRGSGECGYNLQLMNLIDEQYTSVPFYGVRRMTAWLRTRGHAVNHKRINRLMCHMGLYAINPKPRLSKGEQWHKKYPYLLKGLQIEYPNQVWCADITYIRMRQGLSIWQQ